MSRGENLWVVSYDISCNKRRRRVAAALEDAMTRVQYSVFEGRMTRRSVELLIARIEADLEDVDSLRLYSISTVGERHSSVLGTGPQIEKAAGYWLL